MNSRKALVTCLWLAGLLLGIWFLLNLNATPAQAQATGDTCANGNAAPCSEDPLVGNSGGTGPCNNCHTIMIEGGNRNDTDRVIDSGIVTRDTGGRHFHDPKFTDWTSTVDSMIGKGAPAVLELTSGYLNTNYCTGCNGPILGSPVQSNVTASSATVTWSTSASGFEDEPTDTVLYYGAAAATQDVTDFSCIANGTCELIQYDKYPNPTKATVFTAPGCVANNTCKQINDSTLAVHHVVGLTDLSCGTKYFMVNQATGTGTFTHGITTRSTYAVSFRTKSCPAAGVPPRLLLSENESSSSSTENDRIVVIDPNPLKLDNTPNPNYNKQIGNVAITGKGPTELVSHPGGTTAYAVVGKNISVIAIQPTSDPNIFNAVEFASLLGVGDLTSHLAVSPDGKKLYLAYRKVAGTSAIEVKVFDLDPVDPTNPTLTTTISDPLFNGCSSLLGLGISPDGSKLYLPCTLASSSTPPAPDRLYLVDTTTNTVTQTATFARAYNFTFINAIVVKPDGSLVYLGRGGQSGSGSTVEIFDGTTGANVGSIPLPDLSTPTAGVFTPDGSTLYVSDSRAGIRVIDPGSNTLLLTLPSITSHGYDIAITPDGTRLYTSLLSNVFVHNTATNSLLTTITGDFTSVYNSTITPGRAAPPTPDVVMTAVTPNAASVPAGDTLSVTDTVKNQGTASTDSSFFIAYHLSLTPDYNDPNAVLIPTTRVVGPLVPGTTDTSTTNLLIPDTTTAGLYYVCALADSTQALAENNADNNTLCSGSTIQVGRPDLVVTDVTPNSGSFVPGGTLSVTDTVKNQGGGATFVSVTVAYSLSLNSVYGDSDDVAITTTRAVGPLAVGATNTATTNLLIPGTTPAGTYHVCAKADSTDIVLEMDETNNTNCSLSTVGVSIPDLIMSAVSTTTTAVAPGTSFSFSNTAKNVGSGSAGAFTIAFHLSTNTTYGDGDDIAFTATRSVSSLGAGASSIASTALIVPSTTPLGFYYVCAKADSGNTVNEGTNEDNNTLCTPTQIQVTRPDLIMTAVTLNSAMSPTATLSVTDTVQNIGGVSTGSFKVGYKLSPTASYDDPGAVASTTTRTVSLGPAPATNTAPGTILTFPATTPTGVYYLCAKADSANAIAELDEGNNTLCSTSTVFVPPPDLTMTAVSTTATILAPGNILTLSNTVKNQGLFPAGNFTVGFHLSTNTTYGDGDDIAFTTTRSVTSLASGASSAGTTSLTIPTTTTPGIYYVCAKADSGSTVNETDEDNNSLCTPTTIQVTRPDLIMTAVTPGAATVNQGALLSVTDTVMNQGLLSTGIGFRIGYHLSVNTTFGDPDDVAITTARTVSALVAGASSTATTSLTIPATTPPGIYYVCAKADSLSQIIETDENNNTRCSDSQVTVPPPDLIISAISTTATTVAKGASFSLSNTVKNQGGAAAGSFKIAFHLSTNTTYGDGDDIAFTTTRSVTSLGVGLTNTGSNTLTVPSTTPSGIYYVCALADSGNTVNEGTNENNNSSCTATTITVP